VSWVTVLNREARSPSARKRKDRVIEKSVCRKAVGALRGAVRMFN